MNNFDAQQAKRIVKSKQTGELEKILVDIKKNAENGDSVLHIYSPISEDTINALKQKGFRVLNHSFISIQKDDLYYSIYWE